MKYAIYNKVRLSLTLSLGLTLSLLLSSCSNISEDERLIYVKPAPVNRSVLIEDFTGQRCVNCPNATDEIHRLQEQYGEEAVIAVGIHSGPLAFYTNARFLGLRTETGDEYYNYWNLEYQPVGMVNRTGVLDYTSWGGRVREELQKTAPVNIFLKIIEDGRQLNITTGVVGLDGDFKGKLQVWIVENDITAFQMMPDGTRNDQYVHQHVFRTAVNGTWGEDISIHESEEKNIEHQPLTLPDDWNIDNLAVIAFVYDDKGVQQVKYAKVRENIKH